MTITRRATLMGLAAAATFAAAPAIAAPAASLLDAHWKQSGGGGDVDHSAWDGFLSSYVRPDSTGLNRVSYGGVTPGDKQALKSYIASLEAAKPTAMNRDAAMAYWINLYNAKTVDLILDNYPVKSITKIGRGLFSFGPWDDKVVTVEGRELSLNEIEHGILRPIWNDPRIHYAVNCASIGCPNLAASAWDSGNLAGMLDQAARSYVNHPRGAAVENGRLIVSSIYDWYKVDFGGTDAGVIAHLKQYASPDLAAALAGVNGISNDRYDWALNEV